MTVSLAARHKQAITRQHEKKVMPGIKPTSGIAYRTYKVKIEIELAQMSRFRSISKRNSIKESVIPDYMNYVQSVISGDSGLQDNVLVTVMIWCIDVGRYADALLMAGYAIKHRLKMPDDYKRTLPEFVAEEFSNKAISGIRADYLLDSLEQIDELTLNEDLTDEIRAKLHKAMGMAWMKASNEKALEHFNRALEFNPKATVKRLIKGIMKQIGGNSDVS